MFRAHRPILRRVRTAVHTTIGSVSVLLWPCALYVVHNIQSTRPEQYRYWNNGCVNSCVNSPEDGPVGPKHVEIRQYINKIEIVTSVGFYTICWKDARYKKLNPLKPELNPICYLLALLRAHHFLHVSRIRVKSLTLRLLMSYIYIYIYIWSAYSWCF